MEPKQTPRFSVHAKAFCQINSNTCPTFSNENTLGNDDRHTTIRNTQKLFQGFHLPLQQQNNRTCYMNTHTHIYFNDFTSPHSNKIIELVICTVRTVTYLFQ